MSQASELPSELSLPEFSPGATVRESEQYRIVMDWKPGSEKQKSGQRFFIEPKTDEAQRMLEMASKTHNIGNFNEREVINEEGTSIRRCLRADFIIENLPSLLLGQVDIPAEGEDTIPSPDRMEECLRNHPSHYSYTDSG